MAEIIRGMEGTMDRHPRELIEDVSRKLWRLKPWRHPFNVLLEKLTIKPIKSIVFNHFEQVKLPDTGRVRAIYDTLATVIPIMDDAANFGGANFFANSIIMNTATGERMYVRGVSLAPPGGSTLTVIRRWGQPAAAARAGAVNETLLILGPAIGEKARTGGTSVLVRPTFETNHLQKFVWPVELSIEDIAHDSYLENVEARRLGEKLDEMTEFIEKTFHFGTREWANITDVDGVVRRVPTTAGIHTIITSTPGFNFFSAGGSLSETTFFRTAMPMITAFGDNDQKFMFCSDLWLAVFSEFARAKLMIDDQRTKEYGMEVWSLISAYGPPLKLVRQPLFRGDFRDLAMVLDMSVIEGRTLEGKDIKLYRDVNTVEEQVVGGKRHLYFGFRGLFVANVMNHTILRFS